MHSILTQMAPHNLEGKKQENIDVRSDTCSFINYGTLKHNNSHYLSYNNNHYSYQYKLVSIVIPFSNNFLQSCLYNADSLIDEFA